MRIFSAAPLVNELKLGSHGNDINFFLENLTGCKEEYKFEKFAIHGFI